ncbi:hypothetical protein GCM10011609_65630 [Lentzea pudingi]|uniref:Secreted protein n=1 Tax=Lentzea pudingi TaxID=1789439 RepID=A0ABQ2IMB8_9PSEU|nr:hypothetical protein GCM10011609_65630 [Lentzea pudingi]
MPCWLTAACISAWESVQNMPWSPGVDSSSSGTGSVTMFSEFGLASAGRGVAEVRVMRDAATATAVSNETCVRTFRIVQQAGRSRVDEWRFDDCGCPPRFMRSRMDLCNGVW